MNNPDKKFKNIREQLALLKEKGLNVSDDDIICEKLLQNNYYTVINGYRYPFLVPSDGKTNIFKPDADFDELFALYTFDSKLRALLLEYILKVEHRLKSIISYVFAENHLNMRYPDYMEPQNFQIENSPQRHENFEKLQQDISIEIYHQLSKNNQMIKHYLDNYDTIPPWILVSVFSFGMLRTFYSCMKNSEQNQVARYFNLTPGELLQYLAALNIYRNACAHDERIYCLRMHRKVSRKDADNNKKEYDRVYVAVLILKDMLDSASFMQFYTKLDDYIAELAASLKSIRVDFILKAMGFPAEPAVRKSELGPLERGDALTAREFKNILQRYIVPIIPFSRQLYPVSGTDPNKDNIRCNLVAFLDGKIYFAQSINSPFVFFLPTDGTISAHHIEDIRTHLATLIDYIHYFWNLGSLPAHGRKHISVAFPVLCEQAYELTLCHLLCALESDAKAEYNGLFEDYKRSVGEMSVDKRRKEFHQLKQKEEQANKLVVQSSIAEETLYNILRQFEIWSAKTYEGQKKTFGVILSADCCPEEFCTFDYVEFLKRDYSATINDGIYSVVELFADGSFKSHITIPAPSNSGLPTIPYPFGGFATLCTGKKIGVLLTNSGDILIIKDTKLYYTRHNGFWVRSMADEVISEIRQSLSLPSNTEAEAIYQAITDVSYSRGGACIGIINEDTLPPRLEEIVQSGILSYSNADRKLKALIEMISNVNNGVKQKKSFYQLNRTLRRELLELDGAMVFSKSGVIHVIGTIIKLEGSDSSGGGRTAAAMQLSEFGLAIKVSQDGYVQLFRERLCILDVMT